MAKQTVLITGAEGALGGHVVRRFLEAGYRVLGTHHPSRKASLPNQPGVDWLELDVTQTASARKALASAGEIDVLVHCAGGFRWAHLDQTSDEDFDFLVNLNLRSSFILLRELLPKMKKRNFGRIVMVSARASLQAPAGMGAYGASKAGLNALVTAAADEVRGHDINVNAVLPTIIDTPANRKDMPNADFSAWVTPESLAELIFALTQPSAKPVHGALIPVSGRL